MTDAGDLSLTTQRNVSVREHPRDPGYRSAGSLVPLVFVALTIVAQIGYPLTTGGARDRITVAIVLLCAGAAVAHATVTRGFRYAVGFLVIVSGIGLAAEVIGTATGMPFGCYSYATDRLGPALFDVPLIIPLAWTGGMYPVWAVAGMLSRHTGARIMWTAAGAVGWDLFLDPQMVADGQWTWCDTSSGLPGLDWIPVTNYLGWFAVALVMGALLAIWERAAPDPPRAGGQAVALTVPVALFLWTWLGSALAHAVFLDLLPSAGYGFAGLAVLGVPLLVAAARARRRPGAPRPVR
ncbi:carotenoid biosynthesis protein [Streptomyces gardneri]|uniref:carotenoid biosynthesis protein n=1 Tax=Nocardia sputi TaxID=2943705 RepID=UPI001894DDE1|nr:carotenoid biosynthesis protein [Nocardia sputi]MBF6169321.1 carotenoid biosynthesis protein [Streptomyces gardneri]MBF6208949.1 carotenoid biosynthesis protein [Streptomyces gardneri]UAK32292.1 carotenoid biosynthesis protein [Nocardia asteroides]